MNLTFTIVIQILTRYSLFDLMLMAFLVIKLKSKDDIFSGLSYLDNLVKISYFQNYKKRESAIRRNSTASGSIDYELTNPDDNVSDHNLYANRKGEKSLVS